MFVAVPKYPKTTQKQNRNQQERRSASSPKNATRRP
uniref:Uncharacterized protein n=1 Tax=Arundo donax TaxID=35708 RepID=A0A0A9CBE3_ARUDO